MDSYGFCVLWVMCGWWKTAEKMVKFMVWAIGWIIDTKTSSKPSCVGENLNPVWVGIHLKGLKSHAIVKNYCCNNSFNLGRPTKTNEKITFKHFNFFFNVYWINDRDVKLLFKKLQLFISSIEKYCLIIPF